MPDLFNDISLDELNPDGQIAESMEAAGVSRTAFMRNGAIGGLGLLAGGGIMSALPSVASAAVAKSDVAILKFALTLEYLEAAYYKEAVAKGGLTGRHKSFAKLVAHHEATHVAGLKKALGKSAQAAPKVNFHNAYKGNKSFAATSFALENTGVHAYLGQAGKIKSKAILGVAASIVTIEARHAALIADIAGLAIGQATPSGSYDVPFTKNQVLAAVRKTKFVPGL